MKDFGFFEMDLDEVELLRVPLIINPKAKRMILKISYKGEVLLVVPRFFNRIKAYEFISSKKNWLKQKLARISSTELIDESRIPILGNIYTISFVNSPLNPVEIIDNRLDICNKLIPFFHIDVKYFLKNYVRNYISEQVEIVANALNVKYKKVVIKDTKSRWGSCTSTGMIYFSWRLVFAPPEVINYVIAHEVSHLIEMNHSKNFWNIVEKVCPNYKKAKFWLRMNGPKLFHYLSSH